MKEMDKDEADAKGLRGHLLSGGQKVWAAVETQPGSSGLPSSALFDDGNGGERDGRGQDQRRSAVNQDLGVQPRCYFSQRL